MHSSSRLELGASKHRVKGRASPWCLHWLARWASVIAMLLVSMPSAACKGIVCDSCSFQPWLSVCRSHPLVDHNPEHPVPEVNALLGSESGGPLRSLLGNWCCSIAWQDLCDVRSVEALLVPIWAETLVHFPSAWIHLQPISATCKDAFCDSRSFQPWLSGYRSHLLVECRTKRPIPKVTDSRIFWDR